MTSLPGTDERAKNIADSVFISPLTPFSLLVILEREVLPDDASQSSCWVYIAARYLTKRYVNSNKRNWDWNGGHHSIVTVVILEPLCIEDSHREDEGTNDFSEHNLSVSWLALCGRKYRRDHAFNVRNKVVLLRVCIFHWKTHAKQEPECEGEQTSKHLSNNQQHQIAEISDVLALLRVDTEADCRIDVSS